MQPDAFAHVETWVFDLDNTLYPPESRLFDRIDRLMTAYIVEALGVEAVRAEALRRSYWESYGTTLAGLMAEHGLDPDPYLEAVHAIDLSDLPEAPELRAAIAGLPGRRVVYTNGSREHARRVTRARGLDGVFDALYGCEDAGYLPKPMAGAFAAVFDTDGLAPERAAIFEDDARNLAVPHSLGMRTVLVGPLPVAAAEPAAHVDHSTDDLAGFLAALVRSGFPDRPPAPRTNAWSGSTPTS